MELTLTLPIDRELESASGGLAGMDSPEIERRLLAALGTLNRQAAEGSEIARLAQTMSSLEEDQVQAFVRRVAGSLAQIGCERREDGSTGSLPDVFYACAAQAVEEGAFTEAGIGLAALLAEPDLRSKGLLGLAVCAARLRRFDEALAFALESQRLEGNSHPRAYFVAGLSECERGHRREAQTYLVRASRLARREARFDDLRMAQRLLLLMQIGISEQTRL